MKLIKIESGHYESEDGRVVIRTCYRWATCWRLTMDGKHIRDFQLLRNAREYADSQVKP